MNIQDSTANGFPSEFVSKEEKKTKEYGIRIGQAIWSKFNYQGYYDERRIRWLELRKFAEGTQSIDNLKERLATNSDLSYLNLNWEGISIVAKMTDIITSNILNNTYKLRAKAIDPLSLSSKDKEKQKMYANIKLKPISDQLEAKGLPPLITEEPKFEDTDMADIYFETNFKLATEMAMTSALDWVMLNNKFSDTEKQLAKDLVTLKIAVTYSRVKEGRVITKYIDPVKYISPRVIKDDFSDADYGGHLEEMTLAELKLQAGNAFTITEYAEIGSWAQGKYGNGTLAYNYQYYPNATSDFPFWDYKIWVLHFEKISINIEKTVIKTNRAGGKKVYKKGGDYNPSNLENKEIYEDKIQDKYCGNYIIGTKYIYEYDLAENIVRERLPNNTWSLETKLGYNVIAPDIRDMKNKSFVERIIPLAEQMQLAVLNIQRFLIAAVPPGANIDLSQMNEIIMGKGGQAMMPIDAITLYRQTGFSFRKSREPGGDVNNAAPIIPHGGFIGELDKLTGIYNFWLNAMYNELGINDVSAGASVNPETALGVAKLSANAVANAIKPLKDSFKRIVVNTAKYTAMMVQDSIKYGDGKTLLENAIGIEAAGIIELGKNVDLATFDIDIVFDPNDEAKANMQMKIAEGSQLGYVKPEDLVMLENIDQPAMVYLYLSKKRKMYEKEAQEQANENSQVQAQANAQVAQATEQAKAQSQIDIIKAQSELEQVKNELEKERINLEYEWKEKLLKIELSGKYDIALDSANAKQSQSSDLTKVSN